MKRKIMRGLEYHKYRWAIVIGIILMGLVMCKPQKPEQNNEEAIDTTELYLSTDTLLIADTLNQVSVTK